MATTGAAPAARVHGLERSGAEVWRVGRGNRVDVGALLKQLAKQDVTSVLVEGGAALHASFLRRDLVDEIRIYIAPVMFGGPRFSRAG